MRAFRAGDALDRPFVGSDGATGFVDTTESRNLSPRDAVVCKNGDYHERNGDFLVGGSGFGLGNCGPRRQLERNSKFRDRSKRSPRRGERQLALKRQCPREREKSKFERNLQLHSRFEGCSYGHERQIACEWQQSDQQLVTTIRKRQNPQDYRLGLQTGRGFFCVGARWRQATVCQPCNGARRSRASAC